MITITENTISPELDIPLYQQLYTHLQPAILSGDWTPGTSLLSTRALAIQLNISRKCRSLLKAGLVDCFRVVVFPVITGSTGYQRIYDGDPDVALDMIASRIFDGRTQSLEYAPLVLACPPGTFSSS